MHQPFARTVRLGVPGRPGGDAYVAPHGFFLADGSALVSVDAAKDGPGRAAVRPAIEIAVLLEAAYGECRNAPALVKGLEGIARALDAGDLARAAIAAVHLGLPPISDPAAFARLAAADRLLKGGFDPSEPRDSQGRWTTGGGTAAAPPPLATSSHPSPHQSFWDWLNPIGTAQAAESDEPLDPAYEAKRRAGQTSEAEDAEHGKGHVEQIMPRLVPGTAGPIFGGPAAGSAPGAKPPSPAAGSAAVAHPPGSFSIIDWNGYPEGVPRPDGPFLILQGSEYTDARDAADAANKRIHAADPSLEGKHLHENHPIKFGGDPIDPANKTPMTPTDHHAFTSWWAKLQRHLE